jgi:hypothetical protein
MIPAGQGGPGQHKEEKKMRKREPGFCEHKILERVCLACRRNKQAREEERKRKEAESIPNRILNVLMDFQPHTKTEIAESAGLGIENDLPKGIRLLREEKRHAVKYFRKQNAYRLLSGDEAEKFWEEYCVSKTKEVEDLESKVERLEQELAKANERIKGLERELKEYDDLTKPEETQKRPEGLKVA